MADIYREDIATIDLAEPLRRDHVGKTYATGDKLGNRVGVRVRRNHADVDLTGHAATGYFIRPDLQTVAIAGTVEGSAAWVEIPQACLTERGPFTLAIKISGGDVVQTLRVVDGSLILTSTDELIDPGDVVPTLDDIFAQIAAMETATQAATDAADMATKATVGLVNAVNAQLRQIAPPIINTATGDGVITVQDSAERTLSGLRLYGKTTQDGTPSPVAPVPMVNVGASGSITVTVEDGSAVTVQTPEGLPGIPVASGGNYTDASGQQWVCDEIDFGRGVHVQRVGVVTCDGSEEWMLRAVSGAAAYQFTLYNIGAAADGVAMATSLPGTSSKDIITTDFAGDAIGVGTAAYYSGALIVRMSQSRFTGDDSLAEFKAMLAASPIIAAYQLAEPVETPLQEETLSAYAELKTLYPATTVRNDAGAGMTLSYVADTKIYTDRSKTAADVGAIPVDAIKASASGTVVSVTDAAAYPAVELVSHIEAVQEGEGDPSPDNIRPIVGWDRVQAKNDTSGQTIAADLPETVYGGSIDWVTGVLTVTHAQYVITGAENWTRNAGTKYYASNVLADAGSREYLPLSTHYIGKNIYGSSANDGIQVSGKSLWLGDTRYDENTGGLKTWLSDQYASGAPVIIAYKLAQPYTIQLTPQQLDMLKGQNAVWSDCGSTDLVYAADLQLYIDQRFAALAAATINA